MAWLSDNLSQKGSYLWSLTISDFTHCRNTICQKEDSYIIQMPTFPLYYDRFFYSTENIDISKFKSTDSTAQIRILSSFKHNNNRAWNTSSTWPFITWHSGCQISLWDKHLPQTCYFCYFHAGNYLHDTLLTIFTVGCCQKSNQF